MLRFKTSPLFQTLGLVLVFAASLIWSERAWAAPPKVVTSIKPVQALVKMVMGPLGTPDVIIPATASPHMFTLKPSQAKMLENADMIFWIGPSLETTLEGPLMKLSKDARIVSLMSAEGLNLLTRQDRTIQSIDTGNEQAHNHGAVDPHIWLSPSNAQVMIDYIEKALIQADPPNAAEYAGNAKKAKRRISILINKTNQFSVYMRDTPYLVQHDAFGYLAREFGYQQVGYLQTVPGREPGAKHVADLIELIQNKGVKCLFHEPQFAPKLAQRLTQEHGVGLREIDPLGADLSLSDTTYVRIIQNIILSMQSCLDVHDKPTNQ